MTRAKTVDVVRERERERERESYILEKRKIALLVSLAYAWLQVIIWIANKVEIPLLVI